MTILGVSVGFHDAAISVVNRQGDILFAGHSERYSKIKNDPNIHESLIWDAVNGDIDTIAYYETPWKKQLRQLYSGQGIEWHKLTTNQILNQQFHGYLDNVRDRRSCNHHLSHAAAGFQTSPYDRATVVVIDAIGEWDTISIWAAKYNKGRAEYIKLWSQRYPHSIGLFYSAMTDRVGLRPMDEEYITMGMAAYGKTGLNKTISKDLLADTHNIEFKRNLHTGIGGDYPDDSNENLARAAQDICEELVYNVMARAANFKWSTNLCYMGGVALNCLANRKLGDYFDNIWIMPNPGDAGSSLGASALVHGGKLNWVNAYLGHLITGDYPVNSAIDYLLSDHMVGVASGRAEFGPRALGNRSLLADPRGTTIKDQVNEIKHRQKFRPFAPVILEEYADKYFFMPTGWTDTRYMQIVAKCWQPNNYPAICHVDHTSRVQTVPKDGSGIRQLLEKWYAITGCPMLLNTSLNIRGEPMVNDLKDAKRFEKEYNVKVVS